MQNSFHLSLPIKDENLTRHFYCEILGGRFQKQEDNWFNIDFYGHQLTFHTLSTNVFNNPNFHWGLNLDWEIFHSLFTWMQNHGINFHTLPAYQNKGTADERVKMLFKDPNGYLLEFKAYRF